MQPDYVKERLAALDEIDMKLCGMLQEASQVVHAFSEVKSGNDTARPQFTKHVQGFYTDLEIATVRLRNEIKLLDDNTGTRLLPINVNKKALGQDDEKLHEQIDLLRATLSGDTYAKEITPEIHQSNPTIESNDIVPLETLNMGSNDNDTTDVDKFSLEGVSKRVDIQSNTVGHIDNNKPDQSTSNNDITIGTLDTNATSPTDAVTREDHNDNNDNNEEEEDNDEDDIEMEDV